MPAGNDMIQVWEVNRIEAPALEVSPAVARDLSTLFGHVADVAETMTAAV